MNNVYSDCECSERSIQFKRRNIRIIRSNEESHNRDETLTLSNFLHSHYTYSIAILSHKFLEIIQSNVSQENVFIQSPVINILNYSRNRPASFTNDYMFFSATGKSGSRESASRETRTRVNYETRVGKLYRKLRYGASEYGGLFGALNETRCKLESD